MRPGLARVVLVVVVLLAAPPVASAQDVSYFVGVLGGVATLSGDPSSVVTADGFAVSQYKPENGASVNVLFGAHLREYVSVQANYIRNTNELLLFSGLGGGSGARFFEQIRASSQQAVIGDVLVYFRERASRVRPYLSAGLGVVRLETTGRGASVDGGLAAPPANSTSSETTLRVAVGVDVVVVGRLSVRYSFSESISANPISRHLEPPGSRGLMNFQNLIGVTIGL